MKSIVRFSDKPSPIFENINAFDEGSSYISDNNNADLTVDNIDRKNFAGVTPHAIKIEATKNMNLFKQSLIVPEYPMSQSFDTSANQDKLQSYLGFSDSPSTSVNISIPNNCIHSDLSELQLRLANNLMWNSVDNLQENEKLTPTTAIKIIEPFPDFSIKHVAQHHDENCDPNVLKPTSSVKSKTSVSEKSIILSSNKAIKNGLTSPLKSPLKSPRRKVSTISLTPKNPVKIYNDSLTASVRTNQSTTAGTTDDITLVNTNDTPKVYEKAISPIVSEVNARHTLLPCSESPIVKIPVEHNESMSFHSSPAIPPFSVSESSKSNNTSNNDVVCEDPSSISNKCEGSSIIHKEIKSTNVEEIYSQPVMNTVYSYSSFNTNTTPPQASLMNSINEKGSFINSSYTAPSSRYSDVYSQELNGIAANMDRKTSTPITIHTTTITSSVTKLGRQGGVALGKGPRIMMNNKQYANAIDIYSHNNTTENSFDNSIRTSQSLKQAKRVIVSRAQNSPGSIIAKIPERSEATKVDRKKLAFPIKSKNTPKKSHIASSTATLLAQSKREIQLSNKNKEYHQDIKVLDINKADVESIVSDSCGSSSIESCLTSEEIPDRFEKHNVSVQCDSFLLSESSKQHNVMPQSLNKKSVAIATNTSNADISYDYSAISSDLSQKVTPQMNNVAYKHHTPIFHSYYKDRHDSDSEDNIEHGLEEYLSTASSIAPLHSFDDTASAMKGFDNVMKQRTAVQTQPWNHSFCEDNKPWKNKNSSLRSVSAPQNIQSLSKNSRFARTSSSSVLGSAQRVKLNNSKSPSNIRLSSNNKRLDPYTHNRLLSQKNIAYQEVDTTVLTDVGLVPNDCSQLMSEFGSEVLDYSMNSVDITKAETTLTLDHRHPLDVSLSPEAHALHTKKGMECGPRLAILPLKREKGALEDIKEINFRCIPGERTTIALTISNHRNKTIRMNAHTVSLRFEEILSSARSIDNRSSIYSSGIEDGGDEEGKDSITVESAAPVSSFEVYPNELTILSGTEGLLYVTFNPMKLVSGVYSGAIKIRSHRKSFVLLLRGEAHYIELKENLISNNIHNNDNNSINETDNKQLLQRIQKLKNKSQSVEKKNSKNEEFVSKDNAKIIGVPLLNDSKNQIVSSKSIEKISLNLNDSLLLQKSLHTCNRYEAYINATISLNEMIDIHSSSIELNMKSSVSFLKLSKSKVVLSHNHNNESVKVILDENASQLIDLCNKILSCEPNTASTILIGFIMIETSMKCEYTIDVNLTRSTCFLIQQQQQQQAMIMKPNTEKKIAFTTNKYSMISTPMSSSTIQSLQDPNHSITSSHLNHTQLTNTDQSKVVKDSLNTTTVTEKHQKIFFASSKDPIDFINKDISIIYPSDHPMELMNDQYNNATIKVANTTLTTIPSPQSISSTVANNDDDVKSKISMITKNTESAASLLLNFARSHDPEPMLTKPVETTTNTNHQQLPYMNNMKSSSPSTKSIQPQQVTYKQQSITNNSFLLKKTGVFFRKDSINFGSVMIGSLTRANLELCNSTNDEVIVYLGDPKLPFVLLHNEVTLRAKSYVRIPVRYLPVNQGEYSNELIAQTDDGSYHTKIILMGNAY